MRNWSLPPLAAWPAAAAVLAIAWYAAPNEPPAMTAPVVTVVSVRAPVAVPAQARALAVAPPAAALPFTAPPPAIAPLNSAPESQEALPTDLAALEKPGTAEPPPGADGAALTGP